MSFSTPTFCCLFFVLLTESQGQQFDFEFVPDDPTPANNLNYHQYVFANNSNKTVQVAVMYWTGKRNGKDVWVTGDFVPLKPNEEKELAKSASNLLFYCIRDASGKYAKMDSTIQSTWSATPKTNFRYTRVNWNGKKYPFYRHDLGLKHFATCEFRIYEHRDFIP